MSGGHLALASWTRFSPNTRCPAAITGSIASAPKVLEIATSVTVVGSRPASRQAAAICSRTPVMPSARFMVSIWSTLASNDSNFIEASKTTFTCVPYYGTRGRGCVMLDNHTKARKPSSWRSKPILSIRARLLVLALLAIVPLVFDRVQGLELARSHRIDRARAEVIDLARHGAESQRQIIYSVRSLLQIVARGYAKVPAEGANCNQY